jgi:hypothetical protein
MRIYVFASESRKGLHAFAGDSSGSRLPARVGPWRCLFAAAPGASLPHGIARRTVERAIVAEGYQLWRMKFAATEDAPEGASAQES